MVRRKTGLILLAGAILASAAFALYLAGLVFPYDTTGEGYRGDE